MTGRRFALSALRRGAVSASAGCARSSPTGSRAAEPRRGEHSRRQTLRVNTDVAGDDAVCGSVGADGLPVLSVVTDHDGERKVDASTYWRCETCGHVWSVERLRASPHHGDEGRWHEY